MTDFDTTGGYPIPGRYTRDEVEGSHLSKTQRAYFILLDHSHHNSGRLIRFGYAEGLVNAGLCGDKRISKETVAIAYRWAQKMIKGKR